MVQSHDSVCIAYAHFRKRLPAYLERTRRMPNVPLTYSCVCERIGAYICSLPFKDGRLPNADLSIKIARPNSFTSECFKITKNNCFLQIPAYILLGKGNGRNAKFMSQQSVIILFQPCLSQRPQRKVSTTC